MVVGNFAFQQLNLQPFTLEHYVCDAEMTKVKKMLICINWSDRLGGWMFNHSTDAGLMCAVVTTMKTRHSRHEPRSEVTGVREGLATQKRWHYGKTECQQGKVKELIHWCLCSHFIFHGKDYKFWRLISSVSSRAPLHTPWWKMVWPSDIQSRVALPCHLSVWPAFREKEREGRETAKSLWDSSTALRQVNSQTTHAPQNPTLLLHFPFALFCSLFSVAHVIKCGGVCRLGSYTAGNSPPSSYSSSCPSRTLLSPSVTSRCDRLRPLGLCQDQYVWMLGKPLGHATEWH